MMLRSQISNITTVFLSQMNRKRKTPIFKPISKLVGPLNDINWKQVYKGFSEFILNIKDDDELKLVKWSQELQFHFIHMVVKNIY